MKITELKHRRLVVRSSLGELQEAITELMTKGWVIDPDHGSGSLQEALNSCIVKRQSVNVGMYLIERKPLLPN